MEIEGWVNWFVICALTTVVIFGYLIPFGFDVSPLGLQAVLSILGFWL